MKKRLLSIILTAFLVLSMVPYAAFADSSIVCPACGGSVTKQERRLLTAHDDFFKCDKCGKWAWANKLGSLNLFSVGDQQILEAADSSGLLNFSFNNGHLISAEKAPSGIGRKDLHGYIDDSGTPSINSQGQLIVVPEFNYYRIYSYNSSTRFAVGNYTGSVSNTKYYDVVTDITSEHCNILAYTSSSYTYTCLEISYKVIAPVNGYYTVPEQSIGYNDIQDNYEGKMYSVQRNISIDRKYYSKGQSIVLTVNGDAGCNFNRGYSEVLAYFTYPKIICEPIGNTVNQYNKITINNNTWTGNIYTDNSTNLTYIYPQYTTINDSGDTITNISENPIIYNSETKQYYTYDSTTNNYYYITYEQPATPTPSPSPSPSPAPSESPTPDPGENPTPTSTPGGGTIITPGGDNPGSTSTPESGNKGDSGSSGWNPFKWLTDLLKDLVESILKCIWKLITSIFGFILWLLSLLFKLFPWIPNSGILALCAGVVVVTVIRIIKFITGR